MDAKKFFKTRPLREAPKSGDRVLAGVRVILGIVLVWLVARIFNDSHPLLTSWIGMVGIILCLHFGTFDLLALYWRSLGVDARALMRQPLRSTSLGEFWGRRWNSAFHFLANDYVFRPLLRLCGATGAILGAFLVSGLIHDLLLSVPAHGGYGLPTTYFLIQGFGLIFERTQMAKRIGLRSGWRGWLFMAACTVGPVFWLFHPAFVKNVILPMLHALGAT